jgi:sulfate/thiosulfate-binding protein
MMSGFRMKQNMRLATAGLTICAIVSLTPGCQREKPAAAKSDTLVLGAYTVPKEAYQKEIIPAFQKYWKDKTGRDVKFEESYVGSGAQARAIVSGFEADVAALSLEGDIDKIVEADLITNLWKDRPWHGFITHSLAVIGVRPGNPKNIHDWEDLTSPDVEVIYPNPKTSGGAQWVVNAIYGAGLKMSEERGGVEDPDFARDLLKKVQARVKVMDKSARESVTTFERGIGDAIVTYENEALLRRMQGKDFEFVMPRATILIENPIAVVDKYAKKHGAMEIAEEFVQFVHTDFAQRAFARYGFRPANPDIAKELSEDYPVPPLLFDIDYLGGWTEVEGSIYGEEGIWTMITKELAEEK